MSNTENNIEFKDFAQHGVNGVSIYKDEVTRVVAPDTIYDDWLAVERGGWKMLLRSLDDLNTENVVKLKLFVNADRDYLISNPYGCDYPDILYLLSEHFDISNQIGKTAIDIKTLKD